MNASETRKSMTQASRWRRVVLIVAGLGVSALVGLLVAEIGLRLAGISYPTFMQVDVDLGASLRPGAEGWHTREGEAFVRINRAGWRDREHQPQKLPNRLRIAVLGDSYVEAKQVAMERTFWWRLQEELQDCSRLGGREPEVLAFGASGYGTAQEWLTLRHRVWPYEPDLVILAFLTANDIRNNSRALEDSAYRPYYRLVDNVLVEDMAFRTTWAFALRTSLIGSVMESWVRSLHVAQLVNEGVRVFQQRQQQQARSSPDVAGGQGKNLQGQKNLPGENVAPDQRAAWEQEVLGKFAVSGLDLDVYKPPTDPAWRDAWLLTERLILEMQQEVQAKGSKFLVATLSNEPQVYPDVRTRQALSAVLGVEHLFYPDDRIQALGDRAHVAVMSLARPLQAYADRTGRYLHGFDNSGLGLGHWNEQGHEEAGRLLAQHICEQVL